MKGNALIFSFIILCFCCKEKDKSKEYIIKYEIQYPMNREEVVRRIGSPDSISTENYDSGSFGVRKREIYHYGSHKLIFSPHGVYKGLKSK